MRQNTRAPIHVVAENERSLINGDHRVHQVHCGVLNTLQMSERFLTQVKVKPFDCLVWVMVDHENNDAPLFGSESIDSVRIEVIKESSFVLPDYVQFFDLSWMLEVE